MLPLDERAATSESENLPKRPGFSQGKAAAEARRFQSMKEDCSGGMLARIAGRILVIRNQRVLLDSDLAELYDVRTERLNQQIRRNRERFPPDFVFHLNISELRNNCLQNASSSRKYRGPNRPPLAFTEHGAIMAATVLNSPRAVEMSVYVVRAFVKLREVLASNTELARKLETLEKSVATLDARTRKQFEEVYAAIRALMTPPAVKKRPIGFMADVEGGGQQRDASPLKGMRPF